MTALMNIRGIALLAWLLTTGTLSVFIGHELGWGRRLQLAEPARATPQPDGQIGAPLPDFAIAPLDKQFTDTVERPLFWPTRREPPPPPPPVPPKPVMHKGQFQLLGTIITDEFRAAMLRELSTGKVREVTQDKLINGLRLEQVEADRIVLTQYDDREELHLKLQPSPHVQAASAPKSTPTIDVRSQHPERAERHFSRFGRSRLERRERTQHMHGIGENVQTDERPTVPVASPSSSNATTAPTAPPVASPPSSNATTAPTAPPVAPGHQGQPSGISIGPN